MHHSRDSKKIVQIIDDDKILRSMVSKVLSKAGYDVKTSENGKAGLDDFQKFDPDLVLLDVMMPDVDGYTICQELRRINNDLSLSILMMTGLNDVESVNRAFKAGATDFITKPLNLALLSERVRYAMRTKEMHQQIAQKTNELNAIFNSANDAIIMTDSQNKILKSNRAASEMFGIDNENLFGIRIDRLIPNTSIEDLMLNVNFKSEGKTHAGDNFPVEIHVSKILLDEEIAYSYFIRDIQERFRLEKMRVAFVQTVSHELRTPITAIKGALGLLTSTATKDNVDYPLYRLSANACERLEYVVNDIIEVSTLEDPYIEFVYSDISVKALLMEVCQKNENFAEQFSSKVIVAREPDEGIFLVSDKPRLQKVIDNLVNNALKFSPKESTVVLGFERNAEKLMIHVDDQGLGLSEELKNKVFTKFFQVDNSSTRQVGGNGLGLYITKLAVDKLGGTVDYYVRDEGGTRFTIAFPIKQAKAA